MRPTPVIKKLITISEMIKWSVAPDNAGLDHQSHTVRSLSSVTLLSLPCVRIMAAAASTFTVWQTLSKAVTMASWSNGSGQELRGTRPLFLLTRMLYMNKILLDLGTRKPWNVSISARWGYSLLMSQSLCAGSLLCLVAVTPRTCGLEKKRESLLWASMVSLVSLFIVVLFSQNHGHLSILHLPYHPPTVKKL